MDGWNSGIILKITNSSFFNRVWKISCPFFCISLCRFLTLWFLAFSIALFIVLLLKDSESRAQSSLLEIAEAHPILSKNKVSINA
jgi:hypothetical protein